MKKNKRLTNRQFRRFYKEFRRLVETYRETAEKKEINWKKYESEYAKRVRYVGKELNSLTKEAIDVISFDKSSLGRPSKLTIQQKVVALLLKVIFGKNNRPMAGLMSLFCAFSGIDVSYKTIERLYSDEAVRVVLHNMFVLMVKYKCGKRIDVSGDGTGYTLTIEKHYRTNVDKEGHRKFVYSFNLMDIRTKLYVCYGSGIRSEKEAFENAMEMLEWVLKQSGIIVGSARLDKYYSYQSTLGYFDDKVVLYILPKSNTRVNGSSKWRKLIKMLMTDPISYLVEYYKRENSESGFSVDKRCCGWKIWQKRGDRIDTAIGCIATIHNLFRMGYG